MDFEDEINKILDTSEHSSYGSYNTIEEQRTEAINKIFERFMHYDKNIKNKEDAMEELEDYQYLYIDDAQPGDFVRYFNTKIFYDLKLCLGGTIINKNYENKGLVLIKSPVNKYIVSRAKMFFKRIKKDDLVKMRLMDMVNDLP